MADLIITNGDSAAELLAAAGRGGTILPWRDVLHEGPITAGPLEACSGRRATFLSTRFGLDVGDVTETFAERDAILRCHDTFERIELWFEHDLYDQLQLVQILSFFSDEGREDGLVLVQTSDFLGHQKADTILQFAAQSRPVDGDDLDTAERVWADLAMPSPDYVLRRLAEPLGRLPFLDPALHRFLEELPGTNGLSRSETAALTGIKAGAVEPLRLFGQVLAGEQAAFMGDLSFFAMLDDLAFASVPLIAGMPAAPDADDRVERLRDARLRLTETGAAVLAGEADHVQVNGVDRWWAGTRLLGRDVWRYDRDEMTLVPPQASAA